MDGLGVRSPVWSIALYVVAKASRLAGCVRSCRDGVMPGAACQEVSSCDGKLGGHCPCVQLVEGACSRHRLELCVTACYTMQGCPTPSSDQPVRLWYRVLLEDCPAMGNTVSVPV